MCKDIEHQSITQLTIERKLQMDTKSPISRYVFKFNDI